MKKILIPVLTCLIIIGCGKDKFKTQPQIEIETYNKKVLPPGEVLTINLDFTDKEGDLNGGDFVYIYRRLNRRPLPPANRKPDTISTTIPEFPANNQGGFELNLEWVNLQRSPVENDTFYLRFVAIDRAGNKSDTVDSDRLVVLRQ